MTVFQELLSIKRYREHKAQIELQSRWHKCVQIQQKLDLATQTLHEFKETAKQKEYALYHALYVKPVRIATIDYVLACVTSMQTKAQTLLEKRDAIQRELNDAHRLFVQTRDLHQIASRATEKFIEVTQIRLDADLRENARQEDLEMEEVASMMRERDEWSVHDEVDIA